MKKYPLFYLFVTLFFFRSMATFAQETVTDSSAKVYDLNDFKFRYQRYKALEFDYRMNGNVNSSQFNGSFIENSKSRNSDFNLNAKLTGTSFENSERLQRRQSFEVLVTTVSQGSKSPNSFNNVSITNASAQLPYLGYENTSRKYDGNKFLLLDFGGNFSINTNNSPSTSMGVVSQKKENRTNLNLGVGVGIGRGRIENVSDAVTSYFILRDLQRNGVLQNFTATQLENLADGIVKIRNDRYIGDNRFRYVDQITRLDSVCKANGIVAANPVQLFTVLYDNFIFTSYFRETGKRHTLSLNARNNYSKSKLTNNAANRFGYITIGPYYEYVNAVQKSMFLQRKTTVTANVGGLFYYIDGNEPGDEIRDPQLQGGLSLNHGYVYQPNTRTIIDVSAFVQVGSFSNNESRNTNTRAGIQLNSNYFISRRFSLFLNANGFQNFTNTTSKDSFSEADFRNRNFQLTFNSGLTYAFY